MLGNILELTSDLITEEEEEEEEEETIQASALVTYNLSSTFKYYTLGKPK